MVGAFYVDLTRYRGKVKVSMLYVNFFWLNLFHTVCCL